MALTSIEIENLCNTAIQAAVAAGKYITKIDRKALPVEHKSSGTGLASQVVTEVDRHCDKLIREHLLESCKRFDLAVLSEENAENQDKQTVNRFTQPYFWCIDPLDGTLPFIEGRAGYAVSIALVSQAGTPEIGVVYDPVGGDIYSAIRGCGAYKNDRLIQISKVYSPRNHDLIIYADKSFKSEWAPAQLKEIAQDLGANGFSMVYGNGAVKNACGILDKPMACYFKKPKKTDGGGSVWDFSATACIIQEAGGWVSNFEYDPLGLNPMGTTFMNRQGVIFSSSALIARAIVSIPGLAGRYLL